MTGFYKPKGGGSIRLGGRPIAGLLPHRITALGLARTFQNIRLFKEIDCLIVAEPYRTIREDF
jgi:branched-chain amino acid transport system ATP-binding protein